MDGSTRAERGRRIEEAYTALGMSQREFQHETGIDRDTLKRAVEGDEKVRETTLKRIEAQLQRLDEEMSGERDGMATDLAEIHYVIGGGREIIVRGPVPDLPELEASVARLIEKLDSRGHAD